MSENNTTDTVSISPEIIHSIPMDLKPGDPIYCSIPKLGWIKGRIGTQPKSQLSMVSKNGTTYQFIDLSAAPIVSLWAPKSMLSVMPSLSPSLLHQRKLELTTKVPVTNGTENKNIVRAADGKFAKGKGSLHVKRSVTLPNKLKINKLSKMHKHISTNQSSGNSTHVSQTKLNTSCHSESQEGRFKYDFYSQTASTQSKADITQQYQTFEFPMPKKSIPFTVPSQKLGVCFKCGDIDSDIITCGGKCQRTFHKVCFPTEDTTICVECTKDEVICPKCQMVLGEDTVCCSVKSCDTIVHMKCALKSVYIKRDTEDTSVQVDTTQKYRCPRHICLTCLYTEEQLYKPSSLLTCVRCLSSYHNKHGCLPSGCELLTNQSMICYKHCSKTIAASVLNINWCFECGISGVLVCCETCPAAYHLSCIDTNHNAVSSSDDKWYCRECYHCYKPTPGSIVWAKHGNHRWWPAQICGEYDTPENMQVTEHSIGEFVVHFFGTENYGWVHHGRVYPFIKEDKYIYGRSQKGINIKFRTAVEDAKVALSLHDDGDISRNNRTSNKFIRIKNNKYLTTRPPVVLADSCTCTVESPCISDTKCINRVLKTECSKENCPVPDKCGNMRLQKSEEISTTSFWTNSRGWGLKSLENVNTDQFVIEYKGEMISYSMCLDRIKSTQEKCLNNFYMLTIDKFFIVDACFRGNNARFMNHSCDPNCRTEKRIINGETRIGLFANREISLGEELTFDYQLDCLGNDRLACKCRSPNCSGYIGLRPPTTLQSTDNTLGINKGSKRKGGPKASSSRRKKRIRTVNKTHLVLHDDDCFVCQDGGLLIMCDFCQKAYHLECVERSELPRGQWKCPWHFCNVCGGGCVIQCLICPNSYCTTHTPSDISIMKNQFYCKDHAAVDITNYFLLHPQCEPHIKTECDVKPVLVNSNPVP